MNLFASETVTQTTGEVPAFLTNLGVSVGVSLVFVIVAAAMFPLLWKLIDKITPGNLNKEILGDNSKGQPNVALAIVVAAFVLAFGIIIAAAIH